MADLAENIIEKIKSGKYTTAIIKDTGYIDHKERLHREFPQFPSEAFKGACLIRLKNDFREVPYSIFIRDNKPVNLYQGIDAKHMLQSKPLLDVKPNELRKIDMDYNDLRNLWNYICVVETKKRLK